MKKILALGNAEPPDHAINQYIVQLSEKDAPRLCFIGTASGESEDYFQAIAAAFSIYGCQAKQLSLFRPPSADLQDYLLSTDLIYVGGGNTRSMLALWREWGVDVILKSAWEAGILLCGPSAGSICWFEQGVTDSVPGQMNPIQCLGFLPGSNCPHYDSEPMRRPSYTEMIGNGTLKDGYAADDYAGLLYHDQHLAEVVSARPNAHVYRVERRDDKAAETVLLPTVILQG